MAMFFLEMDARKRRRAFWLSSEETRERERETEGEGRETEMTNESAIYTQLAFTLTLSPPHVSFITSTHGKREGLTRRRSEPLGLHVRKGV